MPNKRVIQAGHLLALVFTALLLLGGRAFFVQHPMVAGLLLAACAPAYYVAARVTGFRQFLYPGLLLWVLAFHLLLYAAGLPAARHPLAALVPIAVFVLAARAGIPRHIEGVACTLYVTNNAIIFVFAAWILVRVTWFFTAAPITTALALAGFAACLALRFRATESVWYLAAAVMLASGGYLLLLYSHPSAALLLAVLVSVRLAGALYTRKALPRLEALAWLLAAVYLAFQTMRGAPETILPLGYLAIGAIWMQAALLLYRVMPAWRSTAAPLVAPFSSLLPLFVAGTVLALMPIALFYPWTPLTLAAGYLTVFFLIFQTAARELSKSSLTFMGVALTRVISALARVAPWALFVYIAIEKFPPSYRLSLAAFGVGLISLLAGWRQPGRVLVRRNIYLYQAGVFLSLAYVLAETRFAASGSLGLVLDSGVLPLLGFVLVAYLLRRSVASYSRTLWELACIPAAAMCITQVFRHAFSTTSALAIGALLIVASYSAYAWMRRPALLFTWPVVLGYWIYVLQWSAGIRGERLGLPYLIFGLVSAALGYLLVKKQNAWYELLYFMWFLCTGVSLVLFFPYLHAGAYGAPLWAIVFLLIARATLTQRDFPFAFVLEILSAFLAAGSIAALIYNRAYVPAVVALALYAALYASHGFARRLWWYLYPSAACVVGACFVAVLRGPGARLFLPYFFPLVFVLYVFAMWLQRRKQKREAQPFEWAADTGAAIGAVLFLAIPFGHFVSVGWLAGLAYLVLYAALTNVTRRQGFLAGVGLSGAFALYEFLPSLSSISHSNRLASFAPIVVVLALLGRRRAQLKDPAGAWGLYTAAITSAVLASVFAVWPAPASLVASRIVLLIAMAMWVTLLVWTRQEIFVYCATVGLGMLAYNFVQSSADVFGQHLVAFFLYGMIVLSLVFVAAVARSRLRMRGPSLFVPTAHWAQRSLFLSPVAVLGVATFGSWGVSTSSNPHFCGTCHDMKTYFTTWKSDPHARADIACYKCHYEPGVNGFLRAKVKGTSELVTTLTGTQGFKPIAAVRNDTCLASGCHSMAQLQKTLFVRNTYYFRHDSHLSTMARGPELRCTSCHGQASDETHFAVDTNAVSRATSKPPASRGQPLESAVWHAMECPADPR